MACPWGTLWPIRKTAKHGRKSKKLQCDSSGRDEICCPWRISPVPPFRLVSGSFQSAEETRNQSPYSLRMWDLERESPRNRARHSHQRVHSRTSQQCVAECGQVTALRCRAQSPVKVEQIDTRQICVRTRALRRVLNFCEVDDVTRGAMLRA